ncbi:thiamine diphosphokinase [Sedimentitalea sp. HM32M-2]|uniref:thiamine diphosphokinase n=1 Tax=Sedimentitalea sp. HM32M-2 TaxID=3351566 RepID=UPI00362E1725
MKNAFVCSQYPVTLVGGGEIGPQDLALALDHAPMLVAADGGAAHALRAGHVPAAVIGDFDSLRRADRDRMPPDRLFQVDEQDSTDFDKALGNIAAPLVLAVGFLGARLDHQLAAFSTLLRFADRPCVLIGPQEIVFHVPAALRVDLAAGDVVSLFPLAPVSGRSQGLEWPIDGLCLRPGGRIGTSNRATGPVQLLIEGAGLLAIVPRRALPAVTAALSAPARGPAAR